MALERMNFFDSLPKIHRAIPLDGDYMGDDGLLYCGKCNTRRECLVLAEETQFIFPVECSCQKERNDRDERERKLRERRLERERQRQACFPNRAMWDWTFEHSNRNTPAMERGRRYAENWAEVREKCADLMLVGGKNTGKSYFAACVANALLDKGVRVKYLRASELINELMAGGRGRNEIMGEYEAADLLIIDDIDPVTLPGAGPDLLAQLLKNRQEEKGPVLVTTRMNADELRARSQPNKCRLYGILQEMSVIHF